MNAPLHHQIRIEAPIELVHSYFIDPGRLVQWWPSEATLEPRPGGELALRFARPGGGFDVARGEFVEVSPRRIVFSWGFEGNPHLAPGASRVEIGLEPIGNATLVRLDHYGLPDSQRGPHEHGWTTFLNRLQQVAGTARGA